MSKYLFTPEDDVVLLRETLEQVLYTLDDPDNPYYVEMKLQAARRLQEVNDRLSGRAEQGYDSLKQATCWADNYLHHKPWHSIGISTAVGVIVGFVLSHCTEQD
ncbi:DUF883 family protein [Citrobacter sp. JGM124]|uniref:glycine zipper domain-containing protein n=1 Tax=Citrobacter sp. JGM124 TaxID=2799789 RepID=UPI001BAD19A5|nr:DUF883 family protein [Citrobacter sp. JGM124]MBS0846837.1 DUF883 family protein [Citrobacter sp. JGM124]